MSDSGAPAPRVHLHIGTMKSGTSYLQEVLELRQQELAALGVRYPGLTGPAVNDVLGRRRTPGQGPTANAWANLLADIRSWTGTSVIVSMEFLGLASAAQVEQIVADLRPSPVHVVLTARDIGRGLPSAWQQTTKNRGTTPWPDFVSAVVAAAPGAAGAPTPDVEDPAVGEGDIGPQFWRHHDVVRIARRWAGVVGPAQVTIVTVPPAGSRPELLWERFALATGIDPRRVPPTGAGRGNPSLGLPEAELLRRLNGRLAASLDAPTYRRLVTGVMSRRVLRTPEGATRVPPLPGRAAAWAEEHGETVRAGLRSLGVAVVGDLADLVPDLAGADPAQPPVVTDVDLAATAVTAAAALVVEIADVQSRRRQGQTAP